MTDDADGRALVERLRAERDERRRLAELIHDGPVQLVAAITQMLDAAHHAIAAGDIAGGAPIVERALAVAREASADLREIVSGIEPDALRELGLAAALGELTERHALRRGVAFDLDVAAGNDLGEGAQSGLYQIVRDALDQAVRRGPPTRVTISIAEGDIAIGAPIVERALAVAREASVDLREIVSGIEPDALRELGLAAAIGELTERHTVRRGVAFDLDVAAGDALGEGAQSGLYQIVRDALDQAVRRGPPTRVTISITPAAGGIELRITDDGAQERREAVIDALAGRAAELNGTFSSETAAAGTWIAVRLPPSAAQL